MLIFRAWAACEITNGKAGKENYRVLPRRNLEAIGAVGATLRPFSFGGSVMPLRWSAQPWWLYIERKQKR